MFQKDIHISLLLDFYGEILTERKREIMEFYYNEDYSLSEIADLCGITRQGIRDAIKKSEMQLFDLEEKLGLLKRFTEIKSDISKCIDNLNAVASDKENPPSLKKSINDISDALDKAIQKL